MFHIFYFSCRYFKKSEKPYVLDFPFHLKVPLHKSLSANTRNISPANKKIPLISLTCFIDAFRQTERPHCVFNIRSVRKMLMEWILIQRIRNPKKERTLNILLYPFDYGISVFICIDCRGLRLRQGMRIGLVYVGCVPSVGAVILLAAI
jgi:hypothetical protein